MGAGNNASNASGGGGTGNARRKAQVVESDRVFSRSSASFMRVREKERFLLLVVAYVGGRGEGIG